jgi:phage terminase large subunit-like protein
MSSKLIDVTLPAPHPAQDQIIQQAKRFNVVCCGRRLGKTVLGMNRLIHAALQGSATAWFSPSYKSLADTWRELRSTLAPITRDKSQQEKRLELISGGVVELWSLDSPDSGRGRKYAIVVIDEAAMIPMLEQAWQQSIRPTLTDLHGSAWFLSTPKGMNYFKALFDRGQDGERDDWASWQMPTSANPFIDPEEIEAARLDMTEAAFNQEYLALFVNWEGSVFRRVGEAATATPRQQPEAGHEYIIGCDWGRSNDYTVLVVLDTTTRAMVALDRSNRVDYTVQRSRLRALYERWRPRQIWAEENSIGQVVIEQLTRDGLRIQPFTTSNSSKALAVEALALAFERGDIRILNDAVLVSELVAYQAERLPSGVLRYSAPAGQHDDCVMALAIAWSAVSSLHRAVYPIAESDLMVQPFPIPAYWPRAYGLEVGPRSTAAIWGARDPQTDTVYLYDEYCSLDGDPSVHAEAIRNRGSWIGGVMDPAANGRNPLDGYRLMKMYRDEELTLGSANHLVESGIMAVRRRMNRGQLKVFSSLTNYLEELRYYHCDEAGRVVTACDQLQNATRYLVVSGISKMSTAPLKDEFANWYGHTPRGWMAC